MSARHGRRGAAGGAGAAGRVAVLAPRRGGAVLVRHPRPRPAPLACRPAPGTTPGRSTPSPAAARPLPGGELLLALRDGLWRFDPASGQRQRLAAPPYDPAHERFNDGKADPQGRLWVGTIYEPRTAPPGGALPLGRRPAAAHGRRHHRQQRPGVQPRRPHGVLERHHVAPHLRARLRRPRRRAVAPARLRRVPAARRRTRTSPATAAVPTAPRSMPKAPTGWRCSRASACCACRPTARCCAKCRCRCAARPCPASAAPTCARCSSPPRAPERPADELAAQPLAGCVLRCAVDVPGLPVNFARG